MRAIVLKAWMMAALVFATAATVYGDTPAVMFIIDHSTSMVTNGDCQGGCDPTGNRFRVVQAFIDSIANVSPNAEVGIVIFSNGLVLDAARDANLVRFDDVDASDSFGINQSYMPLKPLNAPAVAGGFYPAGTGSPTVLDVYRKMFVDSVFSRPTTQNPNATANGWGISGGPAEITGTNISLAFAAALKAFESTTIAKENQLIVFLSDGEASLIVERGGPAVTCPNNTSTYTWCSRKNDFLAGVNTPTTFTIFLRGSAGGTAPQSLVTMTNNIRSNGYSSSNPLSNIRAVTSNYQPILDFLMESIIGNNISVLTSDRVIPQPKPPEEATVITPAVVLSGEFTAGPNPVSKKSGIVNFYRQGKRVANCELRIYDATGNIINKVKIRDNAIGNQSRRKVGMWDVCDRNGRMVSEGTYLVKGVIKTLDGKSETLSVIVGVR